MNGPTAPTTGFISTPYGKDLNLIFQNFNVQPAYTVTGSYTLTSNSSYNTILSFGSDATFTLNDTSITSIIYDSVGGGGGGGHCAINITFGNYCCGGGGGGGEIHHANMTSNIHNTQFTFQIGSGGSASSAGGTNGGTTTLFNGGVTVSSASGGQAGGNGNASTNPGTVGAGGLSGEWTLPNPLEGGSGALINGNTGQIIQTAKNGDNGTNGSSGAAIGYYGGCGGGGRPRRGTGRGWQHPSRWRGGGGRRGRSGGG